MEARYRSTLWACCLQIFFRLWQLLCHSVRALRGLYGLSFTDFGILVSLNFIMQVASDVLFSKPVEKYGFRPFAVAAPLVSAAGLGLFAAAPILFPQRPFAGFCAGMFLFAAAGGLQELLLSPILDALPIPEERKARSMSMLHSFFAWGQIFVVLATTGLLAVWGAARWQWIVLLWAAPPVAGAVLFCRVPLARKNGGARPCRCGRWPAKACSTRCWRPSCWAARPR
ncbi:MAG: MFS transporter [Ruthenibacterium lactatiformans]